MADDATRRVARTREITTRLSNAFIQTYVSTNLRKKNSPLGTETDHCIKVSRMSLIGLIIIVITPVPGLHRWGVVYLCSFEFFSSPYPTIIIYCARLYVDLYCIYINFKYVYIYIQCVCMRDGHSQRLYCLMIIPSRTFISQQCPRPKSALLLPSLTLHSNFCCGGCIERTIPYNIIRFFFFLTKTILQQEEFL